MKAKEIDKTKKKNWVDGDTFANPVKTIISNANPNNELLTDTNYYIRLKGTSKYIDVDPSSTIIPKFILYRRCKH